MAAVEPSLAPVFRQGANVADEGSDAGNRRHQQMVLAPTLGIERELTLGCLANEQPVSGLQRMQARSKGAMRDKFDKQLDFVLPGCRDDRIRALNQFAAVFDGEGSVLAGNEVELSFGFDPNHPEIGREVAAPHDSSLEIKFLLR